MIKTFFVIIILMASSCNECTYDLDREQRKQLFFECLDKVPNGPQQTKYNDWDDVISECGQQAYWMANKKVCGDDK